MKALQSDRLQVADEAEAIELYYEKGWTEGLPVVPPTEKKIRDSLEFAGLEPDEVVAEIPERNRVITAEKVAINAVMAGCRKEYLPVVIAAVQAVADPVYKFNHLASLGSPWPMLIINGPVVKDLGFNYGLWVLGPGWRPNATVGRALSLVLWNCAQHRPGEVIRGTWGNPSRWASLCIGENPNELGWDQLHVQLGFDKNASTATVCSTYPGPFVPNCVQMWPEGILDSLADSMAHAEFVHGVYVVMIPPYMVEVFVKAKWSKNDVKDYLFDHVKRSVAGLKRRGRWGFTVGEAGVKHPIEPGDDSRFAYVFKRTEYDVHLHDEAALERKPDIYVVVAGGDAGTRTCWLLPYMYSTYPVTKVIKWPVKK